MTMLAGAVAFFIKITFSNSMDIICKCILCNLAGNFVEVIHMQTQYSSSNIIESSKLSSIAAFSH